MVRRRKKQLAEKHGTWQNKCKKCSEPLNDTFFSPSLDWCLPSPSEIKPEERKFVVDSSASMHMLRNKDSNPTELEAVRVSRLPTTVIVANGSIETNEEATLCVRDVDLFVKLQLFVDTPPVLSLGKLCEDHRYSDEWVEGQKLNLLKKALQHGQLCSQCGSSSIERSFQFQCVTSTTRHSPGKPAKKRSNTGRTSAGTKLSTDNPLQDLPKWLEEFTEHLVDAENSTSGSETVVGSEPRCPLPLPTGGSGQHNLFTHVPKDPICAVCKRATITRAPCRKRSNNHIHCAEKLLDQINSRPQNPQRRG